VPVDGWSVQYSAATSTNWTGRTPLSGTIRPCRYYLVQEAAGAGGSVDLPTPNAIGTIAMAAGAGKVALVTDNTTPPCGGDCDAAPNMRDFVGYGTTANDFEGAPTPTLTNTTAALRSAGGAVDTDNNLADFSVGTPNPRNTPPPATITASDPADGATDVPVDSNVTITFSAPVDATFTIGCSSSGAHDFTVTGGPTELTLDPGTDFARGESCTVHAHADDLDADISFSTVRSRGCGSTTSRAPSTARPTRVASSAACRASSPPRARTASGCRSSSPTATTARRRASSCSGPA
jgi:Bacterial Ig-like domain